MFTLIISICFALACGQYLEFQGQEFKKDTELLSRGCDDPAFNDVFENLAHDPLYQLKMKKKKAMEMWTGEPQNFTQFHFEGYLNKKPEVLRFKKMNKNSGNSSSFAYGYHIREVHAIPGNLSCFYNEKCIIKVVYVNKKWYTSIEHIWIRPHLNENPFQSKNYPLLERKSNYFNLTVLGPISIGLSFIPIFWGYWQKTVIVRGSIFSRHYVVCSGKVISPRIKGFPDGWIDPVFTPLRGDVF
ncbi:hypothetical protein DSO57_1039152 [Entomophthora muscae]|uniref:Uncharacterized protein n=1 Tax=Entomophthora muscae TaxID=34485 RepID=A0ACC2SYW2_9FUNG|nr:hypothetical protein DSO57_1039152 [Entomophthora muscae]